MIVFINFFISLFTIISKWLITKFGLKVALLIVQKTAQAAFFISFMSAFYFFLKFVNVVYGYVITFASSFGNLTVTASSGGNDYASVFFALMEASGVSLAFVTVMNLYISVVLFKLSMYLYSVFVRTSLIIYRFVDDTIKLLST